MKPPGSDPLVKVEYEAIRGELDVMAEKLVRLGDRLQEAYGRSFKDPLDRARFAIVRSRHDVVGRYTALQRQGGRTPIPDPAADGPPRPSTEPRS